MVGGVGLHGVDRLTPRQSIELGAHRCALHLVTERRRLVDSTMALALEETLHLEEELHDLQGVALVDPFSVDERLDGRP